MNTRAEYYDTVEVRYMEPTNSLRYAERVVHRILDIVVAAVVTLLALRIVLQLLAANPGASFVSWLYSVTDQFLAPFAGMFPTWMVAGRYAVDFSALFAIIAYAFIGWLAMRILSFIVGTILDVK